MATHGQNHRPTPWHQTPQVPKPCHQTPHQVGFSRNRGGPKQRQISRRFWHPIPPPCLGLSAKMPHANARHRARPPPISKTPVRLQPYRAHLLARSNGCQAPKWCRPKWRWCRPLAWLFHTATRLSLPCGLSARQSCLRHRHQSPINRLFFVP